MPSACVDRTLELGPVYRFAAGLLAIDFIDGFGAKRADLAIEVLMRAARPGQ